MKTHKIKKSDLRDIYSKVCQSWQKTILELILFQDTKEIEVENELVLKAYNEADSEQKKLIEKYFKIESNDLFSVTTYKEVCKRLGIKELTIKDFKEFGESSLKQFAFHRIKNLEKFFNGDWKMDWKDQSQYKYYPYFNITSFGGLVFYVSRYCCDVFYGTVGFYKNSKTSDHVGKNFKDIYEDLM